MAERKKRATKSKKEKKGYSIIDDAKAKASIADAEDAPYFYSNSMVVGASLFDFALEARLVTAKTESEITYKKLCTLHLSPPHFKSLVGVMIGHLRAYENEFGKISIESRQGISKDAKH